MLCEMPRPCGVNAPVAVKMTSEVFVNRRRCNWTLTRPLDRQMCVRVFIAGANWRSPYKDSIYVTPFIDQKTTTAVQDGPIKSKPILILINKVVSKPVTVLIFHQILVW